MTYATTPSLLLSNYDATVRSIVNHNSTIHGFTLFLRAITSCILSTSYVHTLHTSKACRCNLSIHFQFRSLLFPMSEVDILTDDEAGIWKPGAWGDNEDGGETSAPAIAREWSSFHLIRLFFIISK